MLLVGRLVKGVACGALRAYVSDHAFYAGVCLALLLLLSLWLIALSLLVVPTSADDVPGDPIPCLLWGPVCSLDAGSQGQQAAERWPRGRYWRRSHPGSRSASVSSSIRCSCSSVRRPRVGWSLTHRNPRQHHAAVRRSNPTLGTGRWILAQSRQLSYSRRWFGPLSRPLSTGVVGRVLLGRRAADAGRRRRAG
jgi:hypothetical protein